MGNLTAEYRHVPVMLSQVLAELDPKVGEVVCDCTLGGAGHSVELARRIAPEGLLVGAGAFGLDGIDPASVDLGSLEFGSQCAQGGAKRVEAERRIGGRPCQQNRFHLHLVLL